MKITPKILSIPPYLSTTWKNVTSLHVKPEGGLFTLVVLLQSQVQVEIPNLHQETIDEVFQAHARSALVEHDQIYPSMGPFTFSLPFSPEGGLKDHLASSMEHNPEQKDLPNLPPQVLEKISLIAKAFGIDRLPSFSDPAPSCNCAYCQIARSIKGEKEEEFVSDGELSFRSTWEIKQKSDKLYSVANTLDPTESYDVFLGSPLGCTCGSKDCEHIQAVLKT
ncbi:MAG: hypothetical protein ACD_17C00117G0002 [uncultured bacterium]|nr:MAG: hypothetical protein ACD_17C00117G0002 [uncultured bacterium]OGN55852.1 MAG: hypothetical protein A2796_07325 [Chlamydiae bacterium RIFCSPHIGHO2_01_FULL_44_39]OGN57305.1 MAG: hypothetical protein A3C42_03090 [Chlamydiae bacterium RIFCSPHIGHO2_02_FULL_45_9]OGN60801.1 MAG: hypothetical protein A3D96_00180 [Chlamydiae bacterium RIFCSPHIGHO2_12_FULL_44_59]OGN66677.1 MAG: hypothetical protein A2978_02815 [Chlamydiae bacterium RIFCSPLOWO2_01_FULL_44_52]OGN67327.1 MAG: hypothetical protein A3